MSAQTKIQPKRDAILAGALELFSERGFHGAAVPEIARAANVGAGTIYRYFKNKEALANELYRHWKSKLGAVILDGFPFDQPPREQFHQYWQRSLAFAQQFPQAQTFLELHHHADYLDDASRTLEEQLLGYARTIIGSMQEKRALKTGDPELIMAVIYGNLFGLIKGAWHGHFELNDEAVAFGERCCWEAIRS
jgi:AcrR family transcriptional regulator